jgi:hypothetical protein
MTETPVISGRLSSDQTAIISGCGYRGLCGALMKTARLTVAAYVDCPHCGEPIAEPGHGSFLWETAQCEPEALVTCTCGETSKLPKRIK